jgi:hypothetical protein
LENKKAFQNYGMPFGKIKKYSRTTEYLLGK